MVRKVMAGLLLVVVALSVVGWGGAETQVLTAPQPATLDRPVVGPDLIGFTQTITATEPTTPTEKVVIPFTKRNPKPVIGFSQGTMNHPWRVAMVNGNVDWAKANWPDAEVMRHGRPEHLDEAGGRRG